MHAKATTLNSNATQIHSMQSKIQRSFEWNSRNRLSAIIFLQIFWWSVGVKTAAVYIPKKQCLRWGDLDAILKRFNYANELYMFVRFKIELYCNAGITFTCMHLCKTIVYFIICFWHNFKIYDHFQVLIFQMCVLLCGFLCCILQEMKSTFISRRC